MLDTTDNASPVATANEVVTAEVKVAQNHADTLSPDARKLAEEMGMEPNHVIISDIGKVMELTRDSAKITGAVTGGKAVSQKIDGDDTWLEYGIGANVKLTDKTYIWADVERTEGADIDEEWRGTVGIRYSF